MITPNNPWRLPVESISTVWMICPCYSASYCGHAQGLQNWMHTSNSPSAMSHSSRTFIDAFAESFASHYPSWALVFFISEQQTLLSGVIIVTGSPQQTIFIKKLKSSNCVPGSFPVVFFCVHLKPIDASDSAVRSSELSCFMRKRI